MTAARTYPRVRTELPGPLTRALLERKDRVLNGPLRDWSGVPLAVAAKDGYLIEDLDGNTFADHVSAWGAVAVRRAAAARARRRDRAWDRYGMEITNYVQTEPVIELAERLVALAPGRIARVAPTVTGTEAVEGAVKLAREATGRPMILSFLGQYHGESTYLAAANSTDTSVPTTANAQYVPGFVFAPYPNSFRAPFHRGPGRTTTRSYLDYIENWLLRLQVEPSQIAGGAHRAGGGRGRDPGAVGGVLARADGAVPASTAGCSSSTRCRPAWAGAARSSPPTCGAWSRTSCCSASRSPPAASRSPRSWRPRRSSPTRTPTWAGRTPGSRPRARPRWPGSTCSTAARSTTPRRSTRSRARSWCRWSTRFEQVGDVRPLGAWVALEFVTDKASIRAGRRRSSGRCTRRRCAAGCSRSARTTSRCTGCSRR